MNPTQCRMARSALKWTLDALAATSGISRRTVLRFETGNAVAPDSVEAMRRALVAAGASFVDRGTETGVTVKR